MATSFRLEHDFPTISLEKFIAHLNDPRLNHMLEEELDFTERKLLKRIEHPDTIEWQFIIKKSGEVPPAIEKVLKSTSISWLEDSTLKKKENCIYWRITPQNSPIKFSGEGTWKLSPLKKGCKRVIEGSICVNIPLVGKIAEGFIVSEMKKSYEIEPQIQNRFYESV